jgi:hypothetical protein
MLSTLLTLAALSSAQPMARHATPPQPAPTCRRALQNYRALGEVPGPYVAVSPAAPAPDEDRLDRLARAGATGYVIALVPEVELTAQERDALRSSDGPLRVFRTIGLFVPSDTARAYATCRGRIIRSY